MSTTTYAATCTAFAIGLAPLPKPVTTALDRAFDRGEVEWDENDQLVSVRP